MRRRNRRDHRGKIESQALCPARLRNSVRQQSLRGNGAAQRLRSVGLAHDRRLCRFHGADAAQNNETGGRIGQITLKRPPNLSAGLRQYDVPCVAIGLLASGGVISPANRGEPCINLVMNVTMAGGFAGCQPRFYNQIKSLCHNVNKMGTSSVRSLVFRATGSHVCLSRRANSLNKRLYSAFTCGRLAYLSRLRNTC
jgi:hypothetical protein